MSDSKMRQNFEAWAKTYSPDVRLDRGNHGIYLSGITHGLYCAWVASRESLVIELPKAHLEFEGDPAPELFESDVIKAIEAAGLKVKQ